MADTDAAGDEAPKKKSKLPLIIGLVLMLLFGGGAFYALYSGLILAPAPAEGEAAAHEAPPEGPPMPQVAFVPLDPMVMSLAAGNARHLRFAAQLEVPTAYQQEVEMLKPRVMDVLNGFLRAVELRELEDPSALMRLRAQMLRRIQVVVGENRVNDLLIIEFVMN
ncbi:flagellar basal body-associated FliL family protein [Rhodobacter maris]|uniref:Flagellar protein FliL n=1 Tax=Rhodobacter maris TaxID=446682 RepID=A0A285SGW6_9RHOB|nr:flagellar basal body-associated FliL family protein [Rhodobacter maris]SOC06849.1 flagellar FliL protein [Rhodobacter maris]